MNSQGSFSLRGRNPDVLTCIAILSNDKAFTPPAFANRMLGTLPEVWAASHGGANPGPTPRYRYSTRSRNRACSCADHRSPHPGLAERMPDLQARVGHIPTKQVYSIGITLSTSAVWSRRYIWST